MKNFKLIAVLLLPAIVVVMPIGGKILLLLGSEYSIEGEKVLWVLSPSAIPLAINVVYIGIARVMKRLKDIILLSSGIALGTVIRSYPLTLTQGIIGPGIAWLVVNSVVALIILPGIIRLSRSEPAS